MNTIRARAAVAMFIALMAMNAVTAVCSGWGSGDGLMPCCRTIAAAADTARLEPCCMSGPGQQNDTPGPVSVASVQHAVAVVAGESAVVLPALRLAPRPDTAVRLDASARDPHLVFSVFLI